MGVGEKEGQRGMGKGEIEAWQGKSISIRIKSKATSKGGSARLEGEIEAWQGNWGAYLH